MPVSSFKDSDWVQNAFMIPTYALDEKEAQKRILTDAVFKFTDTTMGGNMVMNPAPQFTRFADIKVRGRYTFSKGMGRYYSEALDDNKQVIHMRFGVPAFTGMTTFFNSFYDPSAGYLANTGRTSKVFFNIGRFAAFVTTLAFLPLILIGSAVNKVWSFFAGTPNSKYYYLKPAMALYWNAVNSMANTIAANMGVVPRMHVPGTVRMDTEDQLNANTIASFHNMMPDIYKEEGGIDVYRVANRAQRLANAHRDGMAKALDVDGWIFNVDGADETLRQNMKKYLEQNLVDPSQTTVQKYVNEDDVNQSVLNAENLSDEDLENMGLTREKLKVDKVLSGIDAYLELYLQSEFGQLKSGKVSSPEDATTWNMEKSGFSELFLAEARDGSQWVSFKVDFQGSVGESFSNNSKESDLQGQLNSMSSGARSKRFSLSDGNLGDGPISTFIEGIGDAMKNIAAGATYQLGLGGLMALSGRGLVDIPKHWDSSSANMPRMDYTIELRSPYGNKMSMFQNIYMPLAMLLAGALPLSTGKQSYTSPFLVEIHSKGRASCRLGLIESMSITRGVGNMGWTDDDQPLGIDVSFTVADLSTIMHMPINPGSSTIGMLAEGAAVGLAEAFGAGDAALTALSIADSKNFDEDNTFNDYMSVLGSLGLEDMIYGTNKLKLRATQRMLEFKSWYSMGHFAQFFNGSLITGGRFLSAMAQQGSKDDQ